jgi:putative colanic acid biosysnthesis UDP-glucose lipid carrier transferase
MTEPLLFKKSFLAAALTGIEAVLPSAVAVACLYVIFWLSNNIHYIPARTFAVVGLLGLIVLQPAKGTTTQFGHSLYAHAARVMVVRWGLFLAVLLGFGYLTKSLEHYSRMVFLIWAVVTPPILVATRLALLEVARRSLMDKANPRRAIFAGYNESSLALARRLQNNSSTGVRVMGFFDDRGSDRLGVASDMKLTGKLQEVSAFVKAHSVDVIYISLPIRHLKRVLDLLDDLRDTTASIYYVPDIFVFDLIQARSGEVEGVPVVALCETPFYGYRGVIKRITDVVITIVGLVIISPLLLLIALLVKVTSPGPVVFKQRRYGLDGHEIMIYKFRSMKVMEDGDKVTQASKSDSRITPLGKFLRKSSIDELPQLINVLQGKMSLVGPRPHAVAHNEQYRKLIKGYMVRHKVLPGITGLAQISGCRGETSKLEDMEARVKYDLDYLRHWTPTLDLKILFLTAFKIFRDDKAY